MPFTSGGLSSPAYSNPTTRPFPAKRPGARCPCPKNETGSAVRMPDPGPVFGPSDAGCGPFGFASTVSRASTAPQQIIRRFIGGSFFIANGRPSQANPRMSPTLSPARD